MVDPKLLNTSAAPELKGSYDDVLKRFRLIFKALEKCSAEGDAFWTAAYRLTDFRELRGVNLGYAKGSNPGSGWARGLRVQVLRSARQIIATGIKEPEFFELLALFEPKIGADRISDMIGTIIRERLIAFTKRVCTDLGVPLRSFTIQGSSVSLPRFRDKEGTKHYLILVPMDTLSALPVALDRGDIADVLDKNEQLRQHLNTSVQGDWHAIVRSSKGKALTRESFFDNPETLLSFVEHYRAATGTPYDIDLDPKAIKLWYEMARRSIEADPLKLKLPKRPTESDLYEIVRKIVLHFKTLVEDNKLREALFEKNRARPERIVQAVFFAIAQTHCQYNDLDISPEPNAGRGPVDFKLSRGQTLRVLVEIKLSNSTQLIHGYEIQVQEYKRAESTSRAIYLVLDVGNTPAPIARLRKLDAAEKDSKKKPELIIVDGKRKPSASKLRK